jgi:branched-chain amino acid transport system permease protein
MPAQLFVSIVEIGCFFALIALSYLVVLYGAGFFHFALGPYAMFSALGAAYWLSVGEWPLWLACLAGAATAVLLSILTELLVVRPIEKRAHGEELPSLIAVVAVMFAVSQLAGWWFGRRPLPGQPWIDFEEPLEWGSAVIGGQAVATVVVTLALFCALAAWLRWNRYGQWLRAVGENQHAARTLGFPVARIRLVAFAVGGLVAGVAGPLFSPKAGVHFESGLSYSLFGFIAFVIGGTGSIWGPLAGGLLLAALQIAASYVFGSPSLHYATLLAAVLFFAFRPEGIFARRVRH